MYPNANGNIQQPPGIGFQTQEPPYPLQPGYLPSPGYPAVQAPGYPAAPGYLTVQVPGYPSGPGQAPCYPPIPGQAPGYPPVAGQTPGYPPVPGQTPGYPPVPSQAPGFPGQATGYAPQTSNYSVANSGSSANVYPGYYTLQPSYVATTSGSELGCGSGSATSSSMQQYQDTPTIRDDPFDATADAQILRKAMKGFGTDEKAIINVLTKRTNNQRLEIAQAFKSGYGKDLMKDLKSELSGRLQEVVLALMTPRYEFLAKKLNKAMSGIGTKEKTLVDILCTATNMEIREINSAYSRLYNKSLESDIKGDTSGHFCRLLISVNTGARDENLVADPSMASQDAQALLQAGENKIGTDESTFNLILARRSFPQLRLMFHEYERLSGNSLEKAIESEFSGSIEKGLLAVVKSARNRAAYFAGRLHDSLAGAGTKDDDLIFIVVTRADIDMENIKQEYNKMYYKSVAQAISGDTNGDYKKILLGLIGM